MRGCILKYEQKFRKTHIRKRYFYIFQSDQKIEEKFAQICACVCVIERERERERERGREKDKLYVRRERSAWCVCEKEYKRSVHVTDKKVNVCVLGPNHVLCITSLKCVSLKLLFLRLS
jgi:hypothetical protein